MLRSFEQEVGSQFAIWVPTGDEDLQAEYMLVANQAQAYIDRMLKGEISPGELIEGLSDFLPIPVENYIDEVEENLKDLENSWGIILTD